MLWKSTWWRKLTSLCSEQKKQKTEVRFLLSHLKACSSTGDLQRGRRIHAEARRTGKDSCIFVATALVKMYSKCRSMAEARQVFDSVRHPDVVLWTALVTGYEENGEGIAALDLIAKMKAQGCAADPFIFVVALKACTSLALEQVGRAKAEGLERGRQVHREIGRHVDQHVQSALIDMYAKCGSLAEARQVFDAIKHPNVVAWNALLMGYAENGLGVTALDLFARMRARGCAPDHISFAAALKACGSLGALERGRRIHSEIGSGTEHNAILVTCLVDLYAKCGSMAEAQKVFDVHSGARDLRTWTALLAGYSHLGDMEAVFSLLERMQDAGIRPNNVTLVCVLSCCSHAGLVEKATECFQSISRRYAMTPTVEHYNCMLDILGRSNKLDDAMALLRSMPRRPDSFTWMTVLGACRIWKNAGVGALAFKCLVTLEDATSGAYVLMATIYGSRGMWKQQELVLEMKTKLELLNSC